MARDKRRRSREIRFLGVALLAVSVVAYFWGGDISRSLTSAESSRFTFGPQGQHSLEYILPRGEDPIAKVTGGGGLTPFETTGRLPLFCRVEDREWIYCFWFPGNADAPDLMTRGMPTSEQVEEILADRRQRFPELDWRNPRDDRLGW